MSSRFDINYKIGILLFVCACLLVLPMQDLNAAVTGKIDVRTLEAREVEDALQS